MERGHRTLRTVGKGNKPAFIPLVARTARTIDLAVGDRIEGLIPRRRDGSRLDRRTAHRWVRPDGKTAGLGIVHPHMPWSWWDNERSGGALVPANERQAEAWNGPESQHFVEHADRYDLQLEPFTQALLARALPQAHEVVLDVGCGSGATTLAAAGKAERATGLDLSRPLVELAIRRARAAAVENADFVIADAQTHDFTAETFDLLISQFGLMFFDDPMLALTNIRCAMRPGGRAVFVSWQGLPANEWLMLIGEAVGRYVELPEFGGQARGPGMFSLCDVDEIATLLCAAGFEQVECESCTPKILIGGGGSLDESIKFLLHTGMARGLLSLVDPIAQAEVVRTVSADLGDRYEEGVGTRVGAAAWVVAART